MSQLMSFVRSRRGRLAFTYLAIIMVLTVIFSVVIYFIASTQFDRPLPQRGFGREIIFIDRDNVERVFLQRANETRAGLVMGLVSLNIFVLGLGSWLSVVLAKRTLQPIEEAMEEQSRFISDASHELRTPLTALQVTNEVALRRKTISEQDAREIFQHNVDETTKLHTLTTSLLGLIKTEQPESATSPTPVALQAVVGDAMSAVVAKAQEKSVTVQDNVAKLNVLSQAEPLTQVLRILLDNAVKYSKKSGKVMIDTLEKGDDVELRVIDEGIGIAATDIPHIFSRFYRADVSRSKVTHDGYGLGLAIAKSISDRNYMRLGVKSVKGQGSTFSIHLKKSIHN